MRATPTAAKVTRNFARLSVAGRPSGLVRPPATGDDPLVGYNLAIFAWRADLDTAPKRKKAGVTFVGPPARASR